MYLKTNKISTKFLYQVSIIWLSSLLLTGCGHRNYSEQTATQIKDQIIDTVEMVYHIPLPFEAVLLDSWMQEQQVNCTSHYQVYADITSVKDFYIRHMDQAGWHCSKIFETPNDVQIIFYSPMHVCCIFIRQENSEQIPIECTIHVGPAIVRPVHQIETNA